MYESYRNPIGILQAFHRNPYRNPCRNSIGTLQAACSLQELWYSTRVFCFATIIIGIVVIAIIITKVCLRLPLVCKIRFLLLSSCYAATPPSRRAMAPAVTHEVVCFCLPCKYTLCGWYSKEWRNPPPPPQMPPQPPAALAAPPAALAAPPPLPSEWEEALPSTTKPKKCSS